MMSQIQELVKGSRSNCGMGLTFELFLVVSLCPQYLLTVQSLNVAIILFHRYFVFNDWCIRCNLFLDDQTANNHHSNEIIIQIKIREPQKCACSCIPYQTDLKHVSQPLPCLQNPRCREHHAHSKLKKHQVALPSLS